MFPLRFLAVLIWLASPAGAQSFSGPVHVIDGDTFDVGDIRVRLHGVDAVEHDQTCLSQNGRRWDCGAWVVAQVRDRFEGTAVVCQTMDIDSRYNRIVAKCAVAGRDLGEALVSSGLARAYRQYSMDYDLDEKGAQVAGVGLWSSLMMAPADFRHSGRSPEVPPPNADCVIKGNISGNGHIYHMPGQENYADTRINEGSGERWFCSEAEARAAGWRAARR